MVMIFSGQWQLQDLRIISILSRCISLDIERQLSLFMHINLVIPGVDDAMDYKLMYLCFCMSLWFCWSMTFPDGGKSILLCIVCILIQTSVLFFGFFSIKNNYFVGQGDTKGSAKASDGSSRDAVPNPNSQVLPHFHMLLHFLFGNFVKHNITLCCYINTSYYSLHIKEGSLRASIRTIAPWFSQLMHAHLPQALKYLISWLNFDL